MIETAELEQQLRQWLHPMRMRLVRGEIKQLPRLLREGEIIESAAQGWYKGGLVLLLATDRRLMLIDHKVLDTKVEDFPYARISLIEKESSVWMGKLIISMPGRDLEVRKINSKNLDRFCACVMDRITRDHLASEQAPVQLGNLQVLTLMLDKGLLSNEEFQKQWHKLLQSSSKEDDLDYKLPQHL